MRTHSKIVLGIAIALLVIVAGVGGWLLRGSDGGSAATTTTPVASGVKVGVPTIVSTTELEKIAADHYPVYWAGERPGTKIEVTLTSKDAVFVRYLPKSADAGEKKQYLTIGTYGDIDGYAALTAAKKKVAHVVTGQNGAVIAVFKSRPTSTYFSFENAGFQVEVFSPKRGESKKLTDDGTIKLVGGTE